MNSYPHKEELGMELYPPRDVERTMKVQEIILRERRDNDDCPLLFGPLTCREAGREVRLISPTDHVDKNSYDHTYEGNKQTPGYPWPTMLDGVSSGNKCKRQGRIDN